MNYNRLNLLIDGKKITKASICRLTGLTRTTLDAILSGNDFKVSNLEKICQALNKPVSYFFDETSKIDIHTEGDLSPAFTAGDVSYVVGDAVLAERIKHLEAHIVEKDKLIDEKNARIDDLKERIAELKSN